MVHPRQTRVIASKLHDREIEPGDEEALEKMKQSFGHEAEIHKRKLGANLTGE